MNTRMIVKILGRILRAMAAVMLLPALTSFIYGETAVYAFLITAGIFFILGQGMSMVSVSDTSIYAREGFAIVALCWISIALIGALPYVFSGVCTYIDAFFTVVSGLTTTGAAVLLEPEILPRGILFWSCFSHWIGGMGVLVFVMAIIPLSEKSSMHLMRAEVPGPKVGKLVPKARKTALILYGLYLGLTVAELILLLCGGMSFYDALLHAFSTAGTGGFSTNSASLGGFDSLYLEIVVFVFMLLFGMNFNIFYLFVLKKARAAFKSEELRIYLLIAFSAIIAIAINLVSYYDGFFEALRYSSFQVASIISTTGLATADFNLWPTFSKMILLLLMVCGACAGSTAGGLKISRIVILVKMMSREAKKVLRPRSVSVIRFNGQRMDEKTVTGVGTYFAIYSFIMMFSILVISINGFDVETTISSVFSCLNNIGPALGIINTQGFADFSVFSKIIFCLDMLVGRLEIFPMITLFTPALWKRTG